MTKAELINLIAEKGDYSKKDAEKALTTVIDSVSETLANGEKISLVHSRLERELKRQLSILVQRSRSLLQLRKFLHSRQARLLRTL